MAVFCYLVADETSRTCALIDPASESKRVLSQAQDKGYRVTHVINTHGHADHTAGNASIKAATEAQLLIHKLDASALTGLTNKTFSRFLGGKGSPKPDVLLDHGNIIDIGQVQLTVIHTPGHSPGSICLYTQGHVFTGDTLFVGGVGRTDIRGGSMEQLMQSVKERIYSLPGDTVVWPGHDYGPSANSTVHRERATNPYTRFLN